MVIKQENKIRFLVLVTISVRRSTNNLMLLSTNMYGVYIYPLIYGPFGKMSKIKTFKI